MRPVHAALLAVALTASAAAQSAEGSLGDVRFPVSCVAEVQPAFDRAVALLHHMTYPLARESFEAILARDPACAMAHWGVAMTLFQPLWPTRPSLADLRRGWAEVEAAGVALTARERLFMASTAAFFRDPDGADYWDRIRGWEAALDTLHRAVPDDAEATAFYALAHLATAPADGSSLAHQDLAADLLLSLLADHPRHPGAVHYLIHANDVRGRERGSLDVVRRYAEVAPRNPHALHMPTHIFTRIGSWPEVIAGNEQAAAAALEHPAGDRVSDEYPHAVEYLVYAHLQRGDDAAAVAWRDRLLATDALQPSFKTAFHLASVRARAALERGAWAEAAVLDPRPAVDGLDWDRFAWPEAVTWSARGLAAARLGDTDGARDALARLGDLLGQAEAAGEAPFAIQIRILQGGLGAWTASLDGDPDRAEAELQAAADLEAATPKSPVTPGPVLPGYEMLGEMRLAHGRPGPALEAFRRSLDLQPSRYRSALGAARAAHALGDVATARTFYAALVEASAPSSLRPGLAEARAYLGE